MIGGLLSGTMPNNNNNDGYNGATISEIASHSETASALAQLPNIVLLHAGTNDMNQNKDVNGASQNIGALIDQVIAASPNTTVFVALLVPSKNSATQDNIIQFNDNLPSVVAARSDAGHRVFLVDMFTQLHPNLDLSDDLHPNDGGYAKMGDVWVSAINYVNEELGWITPASPVVANPGCQNLPTWAPQGQIATRGGLGKNFWPQISCAMK
jgi:lysophospholipase L1-like esterase